MRLSPRVTVAAMASVALLAAAGCNSSTGNNGEASPSPTTSAASSDAGGDGGTGTNADACKVEPPAGTDAGQCDTLPMPQIGKVYNNPQPRSNIKDGGTLTTAISSAGPQWNRVHVDGNSLDTGTIMSYMEPVLWDYTADGQAKPNKNYLSSYKITSKSPMVVKFEINPKATWNNGKPIDWTAFKTTWETQNGQNPKKYPAAITDGYSSIKSVTKGKSAKEAVVTFKAPFYPVEFLFNFLENPKNSDPTFFKKGWINNLHPELGAGPFTLDSYDKTNEVITLKRNPKWWGPTAKLSKRVFIQMEDQASLNAFTNGQIDAVGVSTADRLKQVSGMKNVQIRRGFQVATSTYTLASASPFFSDDAARKAFILGTDRVQLDKIRYQGMDWKETPPGSELMFPFQKGYEDNMADLHYNPDQAKQVLDAAGWKVGSDGIRVKDGKRAKFNYVTFSDDPITTALARAQQQMMKAIGLDMVIDQRPAKAFNDTLTKRNFDVVAMGWVATDPFSYASSICQLYCSTSGSNFPGVGSKALDAEIAKVGKISDPAKAIAAANAAEKKALHLYGFFPLRNGPQMGAYKTGLANYGPAEFLTVHPEDIGWQK